jgi:hypothetical protein
VSAIVVVSTRPPAITWRCPRCPSRVFDCSEKIRANANGKLVDVWLIYRCRACSSTKNITVVSRCPVSKMPRAVLDAAESNDGVIARRWARDVSLLRRSGAVVADGDSWELVGVTGEDVNSLSFPEPLLVDLVHVVAAATGVSRAVARSLAPRGLRLVAGWSP